MSERERELAAVYRDHRLRHQRGYYDDRRDEYQRASGQLALLTATLLALGGVAGVLASADAFGAGDAWALLAAAAPAIGTALAGYEALFGFERNAKIYGDASAALRLADVRQPPPDDAAAVGAWIDQVEGILQREQAQWGQLASDAEQPTK